MIAMDDQTHLGHLALKNLATDPDSVCQIDGQTGEEETKGSMRKRAIKFAIHMNEIGLKTGDLILVCANNHNDTFLPLIGCFLTGVTYNAVDMRMSKMEHVHMAKIIQPKVLFCEESKAAEFEEIFTLSKCDAEIVIFGDTYHRKYRNIREFYDNDYDTESYQPAIFDTSKTLAVIVCSSGSTGLPKGGCHTHKGMAKHLAGLSLVFRGLKMIQFSSNYWVTGLIMAIFNLTVPSQKINSLPYDPDRFYEYLENHKFELLTITPAGMRLVIKHPKFEEADLTSIKVTLVAGAAADYNDVKVLSKRIGGRVVNSYGLSESGGPVAYLPPNVKPKEGSIGVIIPYIERKLVDVETKEDITEPNKPGELYMRSDCFMTGYYNDPVATSESLNPEGWLMTGDLAKIDEDGFIFIMDRLKEVIKCKGYSIHPMQLEELINAHPGVLESVIVGIDHKEMNQMPVAFVKRRNGSKVTASEIKNIVSDYFGFYCQLDGGVVFVDSLPMTPSGKFKKNALKEMYKTANVEH